MGTNTILAIDPGNIESGYVFVEHNRQNITKILEKGKVKNEELLQKIRDKAFGEYDLAIEMIASYGMPVGKEVFDTCVWSGRFLEAAGLSECIGEFSWVFRREEKLLLCGSMKAKDSNITQALIDKYAPGERNKGKGTKKNPGFFYGFSKDIWAAMAVCTVYFEKNIKGVAI